MKLVDSLVLLGVAALPLAAPFADEVTPKPRPPVVLVGRDGSLAQDGAVVRDDAATKQAVKKGAEIADLIQRLGHSDAKVRHDAYEALKLEGEKARAALEQASKGDDPERRFAATQLLDRLDQESQARAQTRSSANGRLRERDLAPGEAAPQEGAGEHEALRSLHRLDGLFDDARLRDLHERLVQRFEELFRDGADPFGEVVRQQGGSLQLGPGSSFSRESDQDGKKESVKITVDADGRAKAVVEKDGAVSNYEADSFETLKKEHPELLEGFGPTRFSFRLPAVQPPGLQERRELPRGTLRVPRVVRPSQPAPQQAPRAPEATDGPRLGVHVEAVDPKVAEYLELEEGVGLRVIDVVADSAADHLGIRKNDVVIAVNGRTIRGVADVQAALKDKDPTQADVTVLRKGVKKEL